DSPHEIPVAKALVENINQASNSQLSRLNTQLSFDPYSYQRRASETIAVAAVSDSRTEDNAETAPLRVKLGGGELIRVVVRQKNFGKIAHKIDRMGDYKPEIIYEDVGITEIDPFDEAAIAKLNAKQSPQFVTVSNDVHLPIIPAFRLLAASL